MNGFPRLLAVTVLGASLLAPIPAPTLAQGAADVGMVSGGMGEEERESLYRLQSEYPLTLQFSQGQRGEWLSDVQVTITDRSGRVVLDQRSKGPLMLVRLPDGQYRVRVSSGGRAYDRQIALAGGQVRLAFNWPGGE